MKEKEKMFKIKNTALYDQVDNISGLYKSL